jgi:molybdopterin synthase sulfur carrier subunit
MSITVRFFASLREQVGVDVTRVEVFAGGVESVWAETTGREPDRHVRVAINQQYADWDSPVTDGDEVAFFPPVTGG